MVYLLVTQLVLWPNKAPPLWRTHLSARMAIGRELLVIFAVGTLGLVQGFGLGPSLEWKDGDAEMWAQVLKN